VVEELTTQDGKGLQLILALEKLVFGRFCDLTKIERNGPARRTHSPGDTSADRSCIGILVVTGPALPALAVEHTADREPEATP
jgi:hypothetical protein